MLASVVHGIKNKTRKTVKAPALEPLEPFRELINNIHFEDHKSKADRKVILGRMSP